MIVADIDPVSVEAAAGATVAILTFGAALGAYHRWYAKRAVRDDDVRQVVEWFRPAGPGEASRDTLPEMVRDLVTTVDTMRDDLADTRAEVSQVATRLAEHLVEESADTRAIRDSIERLERIEKGRG